MMLVTAASYFAFSGAARADDSPKAAKLGTKIPNITFGGGQTRVFGPPGKTATLYDFQANKAIVVVVLNFDCPNSTGYAPALAELCRTYTDKGVAFLGLCPSEDDATTIGKKAAEYTLGFPVYKDDRLIAVKALDATTTPEAFVLDQNFVMRYRGRIDDRYSARLKKNLKVGCHDLRNALEELLAGKVVSTPVTQPIGCPIFPENTVKKDSHVTYYRDVLPILQNHCQVCHRPGQAGPFLLMTYPQAVKWSTDIKRYTQSRAMPPWKITEGVAFHNERRLSDAEIATLAGWADGGTPAGDPTDAPKPKKFAEDWMLGKPDLLVSPKHDFILGPSGPDLFHCYTLPTSLPEDKYVIAIEVKPGNRRVVHHTLNFIDTTGQARRLEDQAQQKERDPDTGTRRRGANDFDRSRLHGGHGHRLLAAVRPGRLGAGANGPSTARGLWLAAPQRRRRGPPGSLPSRWPG
jgi:mono/diheme cytochrome c family protein/peroxiredoxin